jgi:hypothetical protein
MPGHLFGPADAERRSDVQDAKSFYREH